MNILVDIGHPAHVHLFKHMITELTEKNHKVFVIAKEQKIITDLLSRYGIDYFIIGKKKKNIVSKSLSYFRVLLQTYRFVKKNKIDKGIGISMSLPLVGKFTSMKTIAMDDDDQKQTPVFAFFANMADVVQTPDALAFEKRNKRHVTHPSYHELAYLHPNRFQPDKSVLSKMKVKEGEPYFILRFNSFTAHHDLRHSGLNYAQKEELLKRLQKKGKVFISTEDLNKRFEVYRLPVEPDEIHSALFYASMFVGDSQTMTSEAAVLGTPALKCNTFAGKLSIPNELEMKYGLCYSFLPQDFTKMTKKMNELLEMRDLKTVWQKKRKKMLKDKIDVTAFLVWFVENYPESVRIMKENPEYQYRFK